MKTRNKILLIVGIFVGINVALGWISFFLFQSTPDTLLSLCLGVGGVEGILTATIAIVDKKKEN